MRKQRITQPPIFVGYALIIETEKEHKFLKGLLTAGQQVRKEDCLDYNDDMNKEFWRCVDGEAVE